MKDEKSFNKSLVARAHPCSIQNAAQNPPNEVLQSSNTDLESVALKLARDSKAWCGLLNRVRGGISNIWAIGNLELFANMKTIGVVGARAISAYAIECISRDIPRLVHSGFTVISGGAKGVDFYAHQSALHAGGRTIVVLPDPAPKKDWAKHRIYKLLSHYTPEQWLVLFPHSPWTKPNRRLYVSRNRYIVDLSQRLLVVEGRHQSGTAHSARIASQRGYNQYTYPRRQESPMGEVPNQLISEGLAQIGIARLLDFESRNIKESLVPEGPIFLSDNALCKLLKSMGGRASLNDLLRHYKSATEFYADYGGAISEGTIKRQGALLCLKNF